MREPRKNMNAARDQVFQELKPNELLLAAKYLKFNPVVGPGRRRLMDLTTAEQKLWLDTHRDDVEDLFCSIGSPLRGIYKREAAARLAAAAPLPAAALHPLRRRSYREILLAVAKKVRAPHAKQATEPEIERAIVQACWSKARKAAGPGFEKLSGGLGANYSKELTLAGLLGSAQLSGFGVYMAASTLLGAANSALGLSSSFGVFTGLSSAISLLIGWPGWTAVGCSVLLKLGRPNLNRCLPVILLLAASRRRPSTLARVAAAVRRATSRLRRLRRTQKPRAKAASTSG